MTVSLAMFDEKVILFVLTEKQTVINICLQN